VVNEQIKVPDNSDPTVTISDTSGSANTVDYDIMAM